VALRFSIQSTKAAAYFSRVFSPMAFQNIILHDQACVPVGTIEESTRSPKIKLMNHTFEA
jgi:hypothetical protein